MRISTSLVVSFVLYLGLATTAAISNVADIISRDDGVPTGGGVADTLTGAAGTVVGVIGASVLPQNSVDKAIKEAVVTPPATSMTLGRQQVPLTRVLLTMLLEILVHYPVPPLNPSYLRTQMTKAWKRVAVRPPGAIDMHAPQASPWEHSTGYWVLVWAVVDGEQSYQSYLYTTTTYHIVSSSWLHVESGSADHVRKVAPTDDAVDKQGYDSSLGPCDHDRDLDQAGQLASLPPPDPSDPLRMGIVPSKQVIRVPMFIMAKTGQCNTIRHDKW
ncbi:hypothetical protein OG21DRAFT_1484201 [Imleria badia]|nr:hypothetical protein OG21DRAFT_1484201 [Imleria badia]